MHAILKIYFRWFLEFMLIKRDRCRGCLLYNEVHTCCIFTNSDNEILIQSLYKVSAELNIAQIIIDWLVNLINNND